MPSMYSPSLRPPWHPAGAGEEPHHVDAGRDLLVAGDGPRFAGVTHLEVGELVGVRLEDVGRAQQQSGPIGGCGAPP